MTNPENKCLHCQCNHEDVHTPKSCHTASNGHVRNDVHGSQINLPGILKSTSFPKEVNHTSLSSRHWSAWAVLFPAVEQASQRAVLQEKLSKPRIHRKLLTKGHTWPSFRRWMQACVRHWRHYLCQSLFRMLILPALTYTAEQSLCAARPLRNGMRCKWPV